MAFSAAPAVAAELRLTGCARLYYKPALNTPEKRCLTMLAWDCASSSRAGLTILAESPEVWHLPFRILAGVGSDLLSVKRPREP